jgi:hypothetical protein
MEATQKMLLKISNPVLALCAILAVCGANAQNAAPPSGHALQGVKTVQIEPTLVPNSETVNVPDAPSLVQDSLKTAFTAANIGLADSAPVRAQIVLNEFTAGSTAQRALLGIAAGRSSVTCHLVLHDADGKQLSNTEVHVASNLAFNPYQGKDTRRRHALSRFEKKLREEIERMQ